MVTVFLILLIVIYGSEGMISIVNKIVPAEKKPQKEDPQIESVLAECVSVITGGKGRITSIKKL